MSAWVSKCVLLQKPSMIFQVKSLLIFGTNHPWKNFYSSKKQNEGTCIVQPDL